MKKILILLFVAFAFINCDSLTYDGCDSSQVARLKSLVKNINISYDYYMENDWPVFSITINNITEDMYFLDSTTEKKYYYTDTSDGEITIFGYNSGSGRYKFYSNNNCSDVYLGAKYYTLPTYNKYYNHLLCADISNYNLCQKWIYVDFSEEEFEEKVKQYINSKEQINEDKIQIEYKKTLLDEIVDIYIKYYYYFFGVLILVCLIVIFVSNKKNRFKL